MGGSLGQSLSLIVGTLGGLYIGALMVRFLLQAVRADFYNPVSQAIVRITQPAVVPFRRLIPGYRGLDFATLFVALLLNILATALLLVFAGYTPLVAGVANLVGWAFVGLLSMVLKIYFWGLLISIIASWIAPHSGNPFLLLLYQLLEPVQSRFRRILPPLGGLDFTPIFIILAIRLLEIMVVGTLAQSMRLPPQFVIGI